MRVSEAHTTTSWRKKPDVHAGVYELRRKDWGSDARLASRYYSKNDWEKRTVYLVHLVSAALYQPPIYYYNDRRKISLRNTGRSRSSSDSSSFCLLEMRGY
jgi:hypothetical protein